MSELILASTSPYRRQLLERLSLPFRQLAPDCDEEVLKAQGLSPEDLTSQLADRKADSIAKQHPHAVVIGSDQVAAIDGDILGKPGSQDVAVAQLQRLQGRAHRLITAVTVAQGKQRQRHQNITTLHMRELQAAALQRYVQRDHPVDCAGAYKLEQSGISLFERIETDDHSAITGLPLLALTRMLIDFGFVIP